jgi:hypothetical protein
MFPQVDHEMMDSTVRERWNPIRYRLILTTRRHEITWLALVSRRKDYRRALVRRSTGVLIDGYFRSANTFAVEAFRSVNPTVSISEHLHSPFQFLRAARFGIPAILLIRRSEDAVASELVRSPEKLAEASMKEWIFFYETVMAVADSVVVATFDQVTKDFSQVVQRVSRKFDRDFVPYRHSRSADAATFDAVDRYFRAGKGERFSADHFIHVVGRPDSARLEELAAARSRVQVETGEATLRRARILYGDFLALAER